MQPSPCHTCQNLEHGTFCRHLQHNFENGYAMKSHAATCGGYKQVYETCPRCRGGGILDGISCWACKGTGSVTPTAPANFLTKLINLFRK
jgi:DnaJ-class molecular chaperone